MTTIASIVTTISDNTSLSTSTEGDDYDYEEEDDLWIAPWVTIIGAIGMVILIVLAVVGNLLVIISYFRDKQLQTVHNMYILNLAVTDFFLGAISMSFYADFTLRPWLWVFGRVFCKIWCLNDYVMCLHSILLMLLLSLDRVILLKKGAEYIAKETKKVARIKLAISWTIAFAVYGSCVLLWDVIQGYSVIEDLDCDAEFYANFFFSTTSAIFEMTVPCIVLIVLNVMVFLEIRKRLKIFDKNKVSPAEITAISTEVEMTVTTEAPSTIKKNTTKDKVKQKANKPKQSSDKKNLKAAKFLAILVAAFVLTWFPYTITNLIASQCDDCVNKHYYEFVTWLLWSKSSINPFLYASQSKQFKDNFIKLLPFLKFCTKKNVGK